MGNNGPYGKRFFVRNQCFIGQAHCLKQCEPVLPDAVPSEIIIKKIIHANRLVIKTDRLWRAEISNGLL